MTKIKPLYKVLFVFTFIAITAFTVNDSRYFDIIKNIEIYTNVYRELNNEFVDDLDPGKLMKVGIDAMVGSLDPYTRYISESQVESYVISNDDKYSGLGATSEEVDGKVTVVEIFENGAAMKGGMRVGDIISSVNGKSIEDKSNSEVISIMRGAPGSEISVGVKREGTPKEVVLTLHRSEINIPNVPYSGMVSSNIGYIALTTFTPNAGKNVGRALKSLKRDNDDMTGVILDLRGNGGGLLREAINVCNVFIPTGEEVVFTKGKVRERDQNYKTSLAPEDLEIPVVVLINKSSASASEIVSGVLQDYDRAVLVGQRSYGKGLVQNTKEVGYNSRLKLTTSKYYIPSGRCIQAVEYENGEPKDIADDRRAVFYTKNKRPVLDGGGVTPDVKLEAEEKPEILTKLEKDKWIFKYINKYANANATIDSMDTFAFSDYNGFKSFLTQQGFTFKPKSIDDIQKIEKSEFDKESNESNGLILKQLYDNIEKQASDDLDQYQDQIQKSIENQIVSRYYYEKGKIQNRLKNDSEVNEAVQLLNNKDLYNKILNGEAKG